MTKFGIFSAVTSMLVVGACASPVDPETIEPGALGESDVLDEGSEEMAATVPSDSGTLEEDTGEVASALRRGDGWYDGRRRVCVRRDAWRCLRGQRGWRWVRYPDSVRYGRGHDWRRDRRDYGYGWGRDHRGWDWYGRHGSRRDDVVCCVRVRRFRR